MTHSLESSTQRKCSCSAYAKSSGDCDDCREKRALQREATGASLGVAPPIVHKVLASPGQPLPASQRAFFEPRFGHDFSQVRVHADNQAAESALAVSARAYTVGSDLVFGTNEYRPNTGSGQRLLAHELIHVVQSTRGGKDVASTADLSISQPSDAAEQEAERMTAASHSTNRPLPIRETPHGLSRTPLDVNAIDQAITSAEQAAKTVSQLSGQLGFYEPMFVSLSKLPQLVGHLKGEIAFAASYPGAKAPAKQPASPVPKADKAPVPVDTSVPVEAHYFPSGRPGSTERALILGGFHGDEHPGRQVAEAIVAELSTPSTSARPLFFHTIVVPRVNAGGIANELAGTKYWRNRCNRQAVDLNRNFPTGGTPKDTDCVNTVGAPTQPEVQGVIDLIKTFKPNRILSTHAISTPSEAGIFADPNNDAAAIALARGMASTVVDESNRPFNKLTASRFNPIYPKDTPGKVSGGTSLGAFGPTATGGNVPVITIEAPEFKPFATSGTRTTEAFLRPVRAFLTDPALLINKADEDILTDIDAFTAVDRVAFLTGRLPLANKIYDRIRLRIETALANLNALSPPQTVKIISGLRLFGDKGPTGGQSQAEIVYNKFFLRNSPDTESIPDSYFIGGVRTKGVDRSKWLGEKSATRLAIILKFSSLPGASRHHWSTDVDFNSTKSTDWAPAPTVGGKPGRLFDLGVWLQANAGKVGFIQSYTAGRKGGYNEEAWHYSYAPIAIGLRQRYNSQVKLPTDVADAFLDDLKARAKKDRETVPADLDAAVKALKISEFVNDIGPGL